MRLKFVCGGANPVANRLRRWLGDQYDRLAIGLISGFTYQLALVWVLVSLLTRTALVSDKLPVIVMLKLRTRTFGANFSWVREISQSLSHYDSSIIS